MPIRLTGLASGMDTDAMVKELVSAYSLKKTSVEKKKTKMEWTKEAWKDMNSKVYGFYTGSLSGMRMASTFTSQRKVTVSDSSKVSVTAGSGATNGSQTIQVKSLARAAYLTGEKLGNGTTDTKYTKASKLSELGVGNAGNITVTMADGTTKTATIDGSQTMDEFCKDFSAATGLKARFDASNQRFVINAESGLENDFTISGDFLDKIGLQDEVLDNQGNHVSGAVKQAASNAKILVNGAEYESESNTFNVNGLTITASGITDKGNEITVNVASDVDGIYNKIKDFFKDYNELINQMTKSYNAESSKGYDPLTDEEKDQMSDTEVEKWEKKIKDSLFRRDQQLSSIMSVMTTAMNKGYQINGKTYHLSSFGIETMGILNSVDNEQNAYHIAGNKDDDAYANKTDKLKKMIEEDPETVQEFFKNLASDLYSTLTKKMGTSSLSSAMTIYNDKEMDNQIKNIETSIKDWEKKITTYEDKWYEKFAQMEKAMTEMNSQQTQLSSLLGMGSN
ncbi:flagellar hook-associated protein 2 [Lachnospiraceae bacterium XBB1006]|nr:flagellar hook-associated protein 2 [Lachnospiraceae bacterium XBB1006]